VLLFFQLFLELKTSLLSFRFQNIKVTVHFSLELLPLVHFLVKLVLNCLSSLSFNGQSFSQVFCLILIFLGKFIVLSGLDFNSLVAFDNFGSIILLQPDSMLILSALKFAEFWCFASIEVFDFALKLTNDISQWRFFRNSFTLFILEFVFSQYCFFFISGLNFKFSLVKLFVLCLESVDFVDKLSFFSLVLLL